MRHGPGQLNVAAGPAFGSGMPSATALSQNACGGTKFLSLILGPVFGLQTCGSCRAVSSSGSVIHSSSSRSFDASHAAMPPAGLCLLETNNTGSNFVEYSAPPYVNVQTYDSDTKPMLSCAFDAQAQGHCTACPA